MSVEGGPLKSFTRWNFKLVSKRRHFSIDPTLWGPIGQFLMWVIADREIKNLQSK